MDDEIKGMKNRLILSICFLIPLMYLSMYHMFFEWFGLPIPDFVKNYFYGNRNAITLVFSQFLFVLPILFANQKYYRVGFKALFKGSPNMDSLIAIGSSATVLYGIYAIFRIGYGLGYGDMNAVGQYSLDTYFESGGMILTLITVGKYLETKSKGKTSEAITKLMDLAPKTATIEIDGKHKEIPVEEVQINNIILVKPGSSIPVDGVITEGTTSIDESAITGESIPVEKKTGDKVISATVNKTGFIKFRATKVGDDTTLAKIVQLVEEASASKAPIAKIADKIAGIFVPIVITIAVISFIVWILLGARFEFAMSMGIAVLVISCPCALGLATPVAIMVGTGKGANLGILIKSGEALQITKSVDTVVFDKTGTLTEGKPAVTDIICFTNGIDTERFLQIAASIENGSEHPLAEAIVNEAQRKHIELYIVDEFQAIFGKGIMAQIQNTNYLAGNSKLLEENQIFLSDEQKIQMEILAGEGKTPLVFTENNILIGIIAVADTLKKTSSKAIAEFKKMGIKTIMLTGDNQITASAIQQNLQLDEVVAEVLPEQKEEKIRHLKEAGHKVAMIGDGINDAPALAQADVGIAIGAGTDVAIESADIVLMHNDLLDAVTAIRLSKAVIRNIKENLFWAFFYNVVGIPLAAGVYYSIFGWKLNPMFGAATMSISSIFVVGNALRLRFFKENKIINIQDERNLQQTVKENGNQERNEIKKVLVIEGMMCGRCTGRVKAALKEIPEISAVEMCLEQKTAKLSLEEPVADELLIRTIESVGYHVIKVI